MLEAVFVVEAVDRQVGEVVGRQVGEAAVGRSRTLGLARELEPIL
jgi:hypothetical protein